MTVQLLFPVRDVIDASYHMHTCIAVLTTPIVATARDTLTLKSKMKPVTGNEVMKDLIKKLYLSKMVQPYDQI